MKNNIIKEISKMLKHERRYHNITLEELSLRTDISYNSVWNIENGCDFKMSTFIKLCNFYGIDITKLFTDKNFKSNSKLKLNKDQTEKLKNFISSLQEIEEE